MKIVTKIDKYKDLVMNIRSIIQFDPIGEKFEKSFSKLIEVLLSNIPENIDDLLVLYSEDIAQYNKEISALLDSATEREKAFYNVGRLMGLCELVRNLGDYDNSIEKFLKPFLDLDVGDTVYIVNNNILYKTEVTKKAKKKIQVKYGNRWFTQDDYLEYIFPYSEKDNLYKADKLSYPINCDKCSGFRQGKCAYGYSLYTYSDFTYRFDGARYKVVKGKPTEDCCKTIKK